MPPAIPIIVAIASLAATGIGLGESLSNQPSSPKAAPTPTPAQTAATADATKQNQLAAITQQEPNLQSQTSGAANPDYLVQMAALLSGQAGTPGISAAQQDAITKLLTGSTGGGGTVTAGNNTGGGTAPGSTSGLSNTTFG